MDLACLNLIPMNIPSVTSESTRIGLIMARETDTLTGRTFSMSGNTGMDAWLPASEWHRCAEMVRPGYISNSGMPTDKRCRRLAHPARSQCHSTGGRHRRCSACCRNRKRSILPHCHPRLQADWISADASAFRAPRSRSGCGSRRRSFCRGRDRRRCAATAPCPGRGREARRCGFRPIAAG